MCKHTSLHWFLMGKDTREPCHTLNASEQAIVIWLKTFWQNHIFKSCSRVQWWVNEIIPHVCQQDSGGKVCSWSSAMLNWLFLWNVSDKTCQILERIRSSGLWNWPWADRKPKWIPSNETVHQSLRMEYSELSCEGAQNSYRCPWYKDSAKYCIK